MSVRKLRSSIVLRLAFGGSLGALYVFPSRRMTFRARGQVLREK